MAEVKDKLITAESLKAAYDANKQSISKLSEEATSLKSDIETLKQSGTGTGTGWTTNQVNSLAYILKQFVSYIDITADIDALVLSLLNGASTGGSENTDGIDVTQNGNALLVNAVFNAPVQSDTSVTLS